jgi:hypothetical protein
VPQHESGIQRIAQLQEALRAWSGFEDVAVTFRGLQLFAARPQEAKRPLSSRDHWGQATTRHLMDSAQEVSALRAGVVRQASSRSETLLNDHGANRAFEANRPRAEARDIPASHETAVGERARRRADPSAIKPR